jgi:hypothetical protein
MFKDRQLHLIDKPTPSQNRHCTDTFCMIVFAIIFIAFIAYSIFSINSMLKDGFTILNSNDNVTFLQFITQS